MKSLRKLLFPFSIVYGFVVWVRNYFFDKGIFKSKSYDIPVICVGNLSVGGTGKSPMVEYLIRILKDKYAVSVLSRGYGRKTKGYVEVTINNTTQEVGDEPLQIKQNFPEIMVAVCADRQTGIVKLKEHTDVVLLDDAFQHRKVKASLNIMLTPFNDLFIDDFILPAGNLREGRSGYKRADIIVVTKCPEEVPKTKLQDIEYRLKLQSHQKLYFTKIEYHNRIIGKKDELPLSYLNGKPFTLLTGIANPKPLVDYLKAMNFQFKHLTFPDHHHFSAQEIKKIEKHDLIITTQKDFMRLQIKLDKLALYFLPIETVFLNEQKEFFDFAISNALKE